MKKYLSLVLCLLVSACSGLAFAGDPNSTLPPLSSLKLPVPKVCGCLEGKACVCGVDCKCADGIGCNKQAQASVGSAFVGFETLDAQKVALPASNAPSTHRETVSICNGLQCVPTGFDVPDGYRLVAIANTGFTSTPGTVYGAPAANCATCNQGTTMYASPGVYSSSGDGTGVASGRGFRTPLRGILFRGRGARSGGGCCGG